jgi:FKBP-type peptidyl-prolyl cis-trans isomerase SlyD
MNISENKVVQMHYELKNNEGQTLDSSKDKPPLAYIHGKGNIIPGLEKELLNKTKGDKIKTVIAPAEAYGVKDDQKIFKVAKKQFQGDGEIQIGMQIQAETDGRMEVGTIEGIEGDDVTLNFNHPLAGETLHFDVEVVEVRDATKEELDHGHVHGEGGHDHGTEEEAK